MVWAILFLLGIPLWFIAVGITVTVIRNRRLRARHDNIPVRLKRPGKARWVRGNGIWISDVFAFRGSPAAWSEDIAQITDVQIRDPSDEERHKLRHLGDGVQIATLSIADGEPLEVAAGSEQRTALVGPFIVEAISTGAERTTRNNEEEEGNTMKLKTGLDPTERVHVKDSRGAAFCGIGAFVGVGQMQRAHVYTAASFPVDPSHKQIDPERLARELEVDMCAVNSGRFWMMDEYEYTGGDIMDFHGVEMRWAGDMTGAR